MIQSTSNGSTTPLTVTSFSRERCSTIRCSYCRSQFELHDILISFSAFHSDRRHHTSTPEDPLVQTKQLQL